VKKLQLGETIKADIEQRQQERAQNPNSVSHSEYNFTDSRKEAFS